MYKEIGRFGFESYTFIPQIENVIDDRIKDFMEQFKYSLYKNCIMNSENKYTCYQKNEITKVLKSKIGFDVKINSNAALSLLSEMFSNEMEEFMVVPITNIKNMETKKDQLEIKMSFEDFEKQKDVLLKAEPDILQKDIEDLCNDPNEIKRSGYFQLYKARNIVISPIKERMYSNNTLKKTINEIEKGFKQTLHIMIIKIEKDKLSSKTLKDVLIKLFESYVSQFFIHQRLGKTEEEGNKLIVSLKEQMNLEEIKGKFLNVMFQKFSEDFYSLLEIKDYIKFSKQITRYLEVEFGNVTGINETLRVEYFSNFLIFILGEVFSSCKDIEKLVNDAYQYISDDLKETTVQNVIEEYLSIGKLVFAIRARDLSIQRKFYSQRLTNSIEVMSHSLFNAWQYEQLKEMGNDRNPTIVDVPDEEKINTVWFIITDIICSNKDMDLGYEIAKKELENYLEFSYYFMARESEYNFSIIDPYICYNKETKHVSLGRKNNIASPPKEIETFPKDLLEFSKDLFDSKQSLHLKIIECISLYYKMIKQSLAYDQPHILLQIWEMIFDTNDMKKISGYASVIIAGTNYKKGDITYGDMRKILYEDFLEFITHVKDNKSDMLLAIIYERFKVFTKNILGTFLFNIPLESSKKHEVDELIEWILYINPRKENILRRGTNDEEA